MPEPLVTVVVPSLNHGLYLRQAIDSILRQTVPLELFVLDGGSSDNSVSIIKSYGEKITWWRSSPDSGQAASINEGVLRGSAPYVCWLNSDDYLLDGSLELLINALSASPDAPVVYGQTLNRVEKTGAMTKVWTEPFDFTRLATRCFISQPATLIRRTAWLKVGGLNESLVCAMDYDLWWKLATESGDFIYVEKICAVNRDHVGSKTNKLRKMHYKEAMEVVNSYHGSVPLKWYMYRPYAVWWRSFLAQLSNFKI